MLMYKIYVNEKWKWLFYLCKSCFAVKNLIQLVTSFVEALKLNNLKIKIVSEFILGVQGRIVMNGYRTLAFVGRRSRTSF